MQSPKFTAKKKDIQQVVNRSRLRATWKSKVREALRRQIVPDVLERLDFHTRLDAMCTALESEVCSGGYIPQPSARLLMEKSKGLCRQVVIPTVKDALILQTVSDALWAELRTKSPSKNAFFAPDDHSFANSKGHTSEYGPINAWLKFQEAIFGFSKTRRFVVVTDIANYYDSISYDHLRNILADLSVVKEHALDLLIYTLSCMLWQPDYMPRISVGLPQINLDAPRLLAHCFLFEIDQLLAQRKNVDFARFMDDMDIGVDTIADAKSVLRDLDLALQTRQVRLNSGKTKILNERQAREHFKIRENSILDALADRIVKSKGNNAAISRYRATATRLMLRWYDRGNFRSGNGEKILKRHINLIRQLNGKITDEHIASVLREYPSSRSALLTYWQHQINPQLMLPLFSRPILEKEAVDDAYLIEFAVAAVAARFPRCSETDNQIAEICSAIDTKTQWGFQALLWLLSKYGDDERLMHAIESSVSLWITQEHLSRLVAGMFPRFALTGHQSKFEAIIRHSGTAWSREVLQFHHDLFEGTHGYTAVKNFVLAPNKSLPNRLTHPKFLMITTLLKNSAIDPNAHTKLRKVYALALTDEYYRTIAPAVAVQSPSQPGTDNIAVPLPVVA